MKLVESTDGSVTVIELDPTKWYWFIVNKGFSQRIIKRDGVIIIKEPGQTIEIIEGAERMQLPPVAPKPGLLS